MGDFNQRIRFETGSVLAQLMVQASRKVGLHLLKTPVAPGSTVGGCMLINCIKAEIAQRLTQRGQPPKVLTAVAVIGTQQAAELFEAAYDEHARRLAKLYENLGRTAADCGT